jgi:hypothetical protein
MNAMLCRKFKSDDRAQVKILSGLAVLNNRLQKIKSRQRMV